MIHRHKGRNRLVDVGKEKWWQGREQLTHSCTFSPAWGMSSSCNHHPLLAQSLTVPPPRRQSLLHVLTVLTIANCRIPFLTFRRRVSMETKQIWRHQKTTLHRPQADSCLCLCWSPLGCGHILNPLCGKAFVRFCVEWERRGWQGKGDSLLVWECPVQTVVCQCSS